jgi:tryptophan-rich sensory protein
MVLFEVGMKRMNWLRLIGCVVLCLAAGFIGSFFTFSAIPTWYATLVKPAFSPPNWLFGPVWTTLYIMMGIALYIVREHGAKKPLVADASLWFGLQLALNTAWSILFFGLHSPALGLACIAVLWLAIAVTMEKFRKISRNAFLLLVPYIAWVSFAMLLNASLWLLNP